MSDDQISMLVGDIKRLRDQQWMTEIRHVPREANQVADWLAKQAMDAPTGFHDIDCPSNQLCKLLQQDLDSLVAK